MNNCKYLRSLVFLMCFPCLAYAETHSITQENKEFSLSSIKIKAGDSIDFKNNDEVFHNVFSLSDTLMFDLGSYPKGQSKSVKFTDPGVVQVECAIHPNMQLEVIVE